MIYLKHFPCFYYCPDALPKPGPIIRLPSVADDDEVVICRDLEDLSDYANPLAMASLLKVF
jgi:hypothetical protein